MTEASENIKCEMFVTQESSAMWDNHSIKGMHGYDRTSLLNAVLP